ncbi:hypothetical protein AVEN_113086-1 [Araneus ventricosus]|uniref:Uncharacterized protein n=1 Tax=Araneus ventricosus TaxID=182803 RepID=A0A4Y2RLQ0_ARAVE|nr:hypothetical protein AVEN_113086-1 [Araneus ventricosus]
MALRGAVLLRSGSDVLASILKFRYDGFVTKESKKEWRETIEPKIKDKVLKLQLPKSLTKQMTDVSRPIGLQLKRWQESHEDRESGLDGIRACLFLSIFFASEDSESIEVMFRNVDAADRVKLVIHRCALELFFNYMCRDGWQMVEVCLREPALSKEDRERLKKAFVEYLEIDETQLIKWENWMIKRFFEILDETDASPD